MFILNLLHTIYIYMYTHIISIYLSRHVNGLKEETETHPISRRSSESYLIENRDVTSLGASFFWSYQL